MSRTRLRKNIEYYTNTDWTNKQVREEIDAGLALLNGTGRPIVTFQGSHRLAPSSPYYLHCRRLAKRLGEEGYAIVSGGGPGIMRAANEGAMEADAPSIGLRAKLLQKEHISAPLYTHKLSFRFLFVRRFIMSIKSEALVFYPGGFGTLNELFEAAVLMQTGMVDTVPVICVNSAYWRGLFDWLKRNPLKRDFFIHNVRDLNLIHVADDIDDIVRLIEKRPLR